MREAELFIGVLGASNFTYAEATWTQTLPDWIGAHVRMFWTPWKGVKKVRDGEREFELYGFLTTSPNETVKPIHLKAMPAILTTPEEVDLWLTGSWEEVSGRI